MPEQLWRTIVIKEVLSSCTERKPTPRKKPRLIYDIGLEHMGESHWRRERS